MKITARVSVDKCGLVRNLKSDVFEYGVENDEGGEVYDRILLEDIGVASSTTSSAL